MTPPQDRSPLSNGRDADRPLSLRRSLPWIVTPAVLFGLHRFAMARPEWVEDLYARGLFPPIQRTLARISSIWPVSLAETLLAALVGATLWRLLSGLRGLAQRRRTARNLAAWFCHRGLRLASVLYLWFLVGWGFNYARSPAAVLFDYPREPATKAELVALCEELAAEAARLRAQLREDEHGAARFPGDEGALRRELAEAWRRAGERHPLLAGPTPVVRDALISPWMTMARITGIYSPFTGECHVNDQPPVFHRPATIAHEGAHARGFAREDEANFVAFLVCREASDPFVAYSGYVAALYEALSKLTGRAGRERVDALVTDAIRRDGQAWNAFWTRERTVIEKTVGEIAVKSNDTYLKVQGQSHGIASYGRVVDLLLAERRARLVAEGRDPADFAGAVTTPAMDPPSGLPIEDESNRSDPSGSDADADGREDSSEDSGVDSGVNSDADAGADSGGR